MVEKRNAERTLVAKKKQRKSRRRRWVDNIKVDLKDMMGGLWVRIWTNGKLLWTWSLNVGSGKFFG